MTANFFKGKFGIERETLRVDSLGRLAQTKHPFGDDEHLTRDFCENQIELITPACSSVDEALSELSKLDKQARAELAKQNESIWLYSNPPHFENEDEIPIADFTGEHSGKRIYREQLELRYGKRLMLFSGIHFNFSFDDEYLKEISNCTNFSTFKNEFYIKLYKQLSVHSWLPLLLSAASPVCDRSLFKDGEKGAVTSEYASIRSSRKGYWNGFVPVLGFGSLESFVNSIQFYVDKGVLFSASELYLPVRLKPVGVNQLENFKNGISHIELRMFDLNPLEPLGINRDDLEFAHLLIMYLSKKPDFELTAELQEQAVRDHQNAALYDLEGVTSGGVPLLEKAEKTINDMEQFFAENADAKRVLEYEKAKLKNRLCSRIKAEDIYR